MNGYFLLRVAYVIICWLILLAPISTTNSLASICASFLLYYIPLGFDYWTHEPLIITERDRKRRKCGVVTPVILSAICIAIVILSSQGFNFIDSEWVTYIKYVIWIISGWFIHLAFQDFIAYSDNEEIKVRQKKREQQREKVMEERIEMEDRETYYKKMQTKSYVVNNSKKKRRKRK